MSVSRGKSAGNGVEMKSGRDSRRWMVAMGYAREEDGKGVARGSGEDGEVERKHRNGEEAIGLGRWCWRGIRGGTAYLGGGGSRTVNRVGSA